MPKVTYNNISFDSETELSFYHWLVEATKHGYIKSFNYHPRVFELSDGITYDKTVVKKTKTTTVQRSLLSPHVYTPDYTIELDSLFKTLKLPIPEPLYDYKEIYIDVKGNFSRHGDQVAFPINQKWVYDKYGIYILKVIPDDWFVDTWVPTDSRLTDKTKVVQSKYINVKTINQYLGKEEFIYTPVPTKEEKKLLRQQAKEEKLRIKLLKRK